MQFKGRTVFAFVLLTMVASVIVTLTFADRAVLSEIGSRTGLASAESQQASESLNRQEMAKLNAVLSLIETKYYKEVDRDKVMDGAISGMISALDDPYSVYMEEEAAEHFSESIEGSFTGIGAEVTMDNGNITIVAPIKDSPAERAGLLPKDVLLSVNGESLNGLKLNEAVAKIRGPKGTKAKLEIQREGVSQPIQLIIIRDDIDVETVYAKMLPDQIGKIEIRQFSMNTGDRFNEELERLESQGMKGLIIDVRNNPGGVLPVVVSVAQPFVPKGKPIVQVEERNGKVDKTLSQGSSKPYPVAVLVNKGSASASEVLAGALSEEAGATIVGETTFGKGTVQVSYNKALGDGSLVKMTIAKWLTPHGNWVNEKGIEPDIEVLPPDYYSAPRLAKSTTLTKDMLGEEVRSMQMMLSGLGYKVDRKDGYFSNQTEQAVKAFQSKEGIPVTGKADPKTAELLEQELINWVRDDKNDGQLAEAVRVIQERLGTQ
ncbi:S41 family peptidase [Paenibacillus abyssi]|uniref:Carboxy-terminal processing protease CtpB n=1 Tax=Paenibacillus abyssi TaxID=1340531 RepID=A0A917D1X0_9BACL|nr:S41 family peptidase [Paenibacillus abyssi]GGG06711.1 carboxy-terminal processing protease CtpB [Paenibacillus abyssi]